MMRLVFVIALFCCAFSLHAESKRVNVYQGSQYYWDVKAGQTLSQICQQWRFGAQSSSGDCQQYIMGSNPQAFINNNPDYLLAGSRLWLPGSQQPTNVKDNNRYHIQNFSWGSIKTPK